jgi:hypothetical protein
METQNSAAEKSSLEGLWVLLVTEDSTRVPMMARAGNDETYLLGFRNVVSARRFMEKSAVVNAEPRMIVKSNKDEFIRMAQTQGVVGVLVDYDPSTHNYAGAAELY